MWFELYVKSRLVPSHRAFTLTYCVIHDTLVFLFKQKGSAPRYEKQAFNMFALSNHGKTKAAIFFITILRVKLYVTLNLHFLYTMSICSYL